MRSGTQLYQWRRSSVSHTPLSGSNVFHGVTVPTSNPHMKDPQNHWQQFFSDYQREGVWGVSLKLHARYELIQSVGQLSGGDDHQRSLGG